ncbi:MAG: biotin--[acetyl-CoA-carboxylase] ligase [Lachnospiraceae bacterium]|nr:biotin--[acetyl-CoA-carboxylase] ligase [Lachnospiraceae bacterium]
MKKEDILRQLRETDGFVSGQELCAQYGVSRTAVWKAIKQLEKDGYVIEAQNNKGYRLAKDTAGMVFSKAAVESCMDTKQIARKLVFHKETGSTNLDAKALAEKGAEPGTLVVADMQTAGRGRRGRSWDGASGKNIYMSLVLRPDCPPDKASALTLVMALSVAEAVKELSPDVSCMIKWPNDIVINGKKACGILTEMSAEPDCIHYVVIGVGINVNQTEFPNKISDTATSLFLEYGREIDRSRLVAAIMKRFEECYCLFKERYLLTPLLDRYNSMLVNMDRQVRVLDPKGEYEGIAKGANEKGELIVERADSGETVCVYAGEVSVRGVYGYAV